MSVTRITYKRIMNYPSLVDFDKKSIKSIPLTCKERIPAITEDIANGIATELEISGSNISSISIHRLIIASNAAKYYAIIVDDRFTTTGVSFPANFLKLNSILKRGAGK